MEVNPKSKKAPSAKIYETAACSWGDWDLMYDGGYLGTNYKLKILTIAPDNGTSLQKHYHRAEFWVVVDGEGVVEIGDRLTDVTPGSTIQVLRGELHRICNTGLIPLVVLELQFGPVCEESDIVRFT